MNEKPNYEELSEQVERLTLQLNMLQAWTLELSRALSGLSDIDLRAEADRIEEGAR